MTEIQPFEPTSAEVMANPYPFYHALRAAEPVHYNPKGFWFLSRYDDIAEVLRDPRFSNRPAPFALLHPRNREKFVASDVASNMFAFSDAPDHGDGRRPYASAFGKRLRAAEAEIEAISADVVAGLPTGTPFDAVQDFAAACALRNIACMIGLPEKDLPQIAAWSSDFFFMFHVIPDAKTMELLNDTATAFRNYVCDLVASPRRDGLLADLAADTAPEDRVALADNLMLLIADGIENVRAGLASAVDKILSHPECLEVVRTDTDALDRAIDEALRMESPGQYQGRITLEPVTVGGKEIRARSIVLLGYGAGNRDPEIFETPDVFRIDRPDQRPMTFGMGPHACLGVALVRVQARAALSALLARPVRLSDPDTPRVWVKRPGHRWLDHLEIEITT